MAAGNAQSWRAVSTAINENVDDVEEFFAYCGFWGRNRGCQGSLSGARPVPAGTCEIARRTGPYRPRLSGTTAVKKIDSYKYRQEIDDTSNSRQTHRLTFIRRAQMAWLRIARIAMIDEGTATASLRGTEDQGRLDPNHHPWTMGPRLRSREERRCLV